MLKNAQIKLAELAQVIESTCRCVRCAPGFHAAHLARKEQQRLERIYLSGERRFIKYATAATNDIGCYLWSGTLDKKGYGVIGIGGKQIMAHRYAHERIHGPLRREVTIDHVCNVKACVNPEHFDLVDGAVNSMRSSNPCAENARKTVPDCGHTFDQTNKLGWRSCKVCANFHSAARQREIRAKKAQNPL